jgi:hypothetical protein
MNGDAPPSEAAADVVDQIAFEVLAETADMAISYAGALGDAAVRGDRARARLYACQLSRVTRTALITVADLFESRRAAA